MSDDPFDELFSHEEQYFKEGYDQGFADGRQQSHAEARLFGIEQAYKKFVIMGELLAKARLWQAGQENAQSAAGVQGTSGRLSKHIETLLALVDPTTLSYNNTDDAISEYDDRLKRALAKARVIERLLGETSNREPRSLENNGQAGTSNIEDFKAR